MEKLALFVPAFLLCMLNSITTRVFRKKFGYAILFTIAASITLMYLFQLLCNSWQPGFITLLILAAGGVFFLATDKKNRRDFFSYGFIAFLAVYFLTWVLCLRRCFTDFDEFWCWGVMIKESLRLDNFYTVPASKLIIHKDYPPFPAIWELLWVKTVNRYSENTVIMSMVIESLTFTVVPLFERMGERGELCVSFGKRNRIIRSGASALLLTILTILVISAFDYKRVFFSILVDVPLSALFACGVVHILCGDAASSAFGLVTLSAIGVMMVMTKLPGIAFLPILWLLYIIWNKPADRKERKKRFLKSLWILFIPIVFFVTWQLYVKTQNIHGLRVTANGRGQFDIAKISVRAYIEALLKRGDSLRWNTFWNLIRAFFTEPVSNLAWPPFTFVTSFFMLLIGIICLNRWFREDFDDHKARLISIFLVLFTIGYGFMMSLLYTFFFEPDEMSELRGYIRYIDIYIISILLILLPMSLLLMGKRRASSRRLRNQLAITLLAAVVLNNMTIIHILPYHTEEYKAYKNLADQILEQTEAGSRITIAYDIGGKHYGSWYGSLQSVAYYYADDRDLLWGIDLFSADYDNHEQYAEVINQLEESDYLFVVDSNDEMDAALSVFNDGDDLESGTMYRITNSSGLMLSRL